MKTKSKLIAILISLLFVSCSTDLAQKIIGEWKVSDMKTDIKNVPDLLVENAKTLSLATTYKFKNDGKYCMTISKNSLENGRVHKGELELDSKDNRILLKTDTIFIEKSGNRKLVEKSEFNSPLFKTVTLKVEKVTSNQMILSQKERNGNIFYTLDRITD